MGERPKRHTALAIGLDTTEARAGEGIGLIKGTSRANRVISSQTDSLARAS